MRMRDGGNPAGFDRRSRSQRARFLCFRAAGKIRRISVAFIVLSLSLLPYQTANADGAQIVTDGRTQTTLDINGNITDVRTSTIKGGNAFNSFRRFDVNRGNTVNLHVPDTAQNLINLVRDRRTNIDGVLNAYKNGEIGGNVYILNPNGITVGKSGVINVGALSLQTPSREFLDSVLGPSGDINDAVVHTILNDPTKIPISPSGLITVDGTINAPGGVRMRGGGVSVGGGVRVGHSAFVNIKGMQLHGAVRTKRRTTRVRRQPVRRAARADLPKAESLPVSITNDPGPSIGISAVSDVTISGVLKTDGTDGERGGAINIIAKGNISLQQGSVLSARGVGIESDGGDIIVLADVRTDFDAGALIDVSGGEISGHGGFAEVSAKQIVGLNGGEFLGGATDGEAGHLLIDPEDIDQTGDVINRDGSSITLEADETITIRDNVILSSRNVAAGTADGDLETAASIGNSGDITLRAKVITVEDGAKILAHGDSGFTGGTVALEATDNDTFLAVSQTSAQISIGAARITGELVRFRADAQAKSTLFADPETLGNAETRPVGAFFSSIVPTIVTAIAGFDLPVSVATAEAGVRLLNGARIEADGDIIIDVDADTTSEGMPTLALLAKIGVDAPPLSSLTDIPIISVHYGHSAGNAIAAIDPGAELKVGRNLDIDATTTNELNADLLTSTRESNQIDTVIAIGVGISDSLVSIGDGATIDLGASPGDVTINAETNSDYNTSATVMTLSQSGGGIGTTIAISDYFDRARANVAADIEANNVSIQSVSRVANAKTTASTGVGKGIATKVISGLNNAAPATSVKAGLNLFADTRLGRAFSKVADLGGETSGGGIPFQLAGAVSVMINSHEARAQIISETEVNALNDVIVEAEVLFVDEDVSGTEFDGNLQNYVEASGEGDTDENDVSIALALPITDTQIISYAGIGANAIVNAGNEIRVKARSILPDKENWAKWEGISTIGDKFNTNLGLVNGFVNTGSRSVAGAGNNTDNKSFAFAANATITNIDVDTDAVIGDGAQLNQNAAYDSLNQTVNVEADTLLEGVHVSGNVGILGVLTGTEASSTGIGMALGIISYDTHTHATIGEGAKVDAEKDVNVWAHSKEVMINIGISTSYKGGDIGIGGVSVANLIDVDTLAEIGADAEVTAGNNVVVDADDEVINWNLAGSVISGDNAGVGVSVSVNSLDATVRALIDGAEAVTAGNLLDVDAYSTGDINAYSLAAAITKPSDPSVPGSFDQLKNYFGDKISGSDSGIAKVLTNAYDKLSAAVANGGADAIDDNAEGTGSNSDAASAGKGSGILDKLADKTGEFGITVSGDVAINRYESDVQAGIDATTTIDSATIDVDAMNDLRVNSAVGAVSVQSFKDPTSPKKTSLGIAGAVAVNVIDGNRTDAFIRDVGDLRASRNINLDAINDQQIISVAAGGSGSGGGKQGSSFSGTVAGSVTVNVITGMETLAEIRNTTISGTGAGPTLDLPDAITVFARDTSEIDSGAGAVAVAVDGKNTGGKSGGVGASGAANLIDSDVTARVIDTSIPDAQSLSVKAESNRDIITLTAAVAVASGGSKVAAAANFSFSSIGGLSLAEIVDSSVTTSGRTQAETVDTSQIIAIAGDVGVGSKAGIGISGVVNSIVTSSFARVSGGTLNAGDIVIHGKLEREIYGIAFGVAASTGGGLSLKGSVVVNLLGNDDDTDGRDGVISEVVGGAQVTTTSGDVDVRAEDDSNIFGLAGGVSLSGGSAGASIGAAIAINKLQAEITSTIGDATINTAQDLLVTSLADSEIVTIGASVSAGATTPAAVSGGITVNVLASRATAEITEDATVNSDANRARDVLVSADDSGRVDTLTGAVAATGGTAGIGGALATDVLAKRTRARISGTVRATREVRAEAISAAKSFGGLLTVGAGNTAGVSVAVGVAVIVNDVKGYIGSAADIHTDGTVVVNAQDKSDIIHASLSSAAGGTAGVGALASLHVAKGETQAYIDDDAVVVGLGHTSAQVRTGGQNYVDEIVSGSYDEDGEEFEETRNAIHNDDEPENEDDGTFANAKDFLDDDNVDDELENVRGVAVVANSDLRLINIGVAVAGGGTAGVGVGITASVAVTETLAWIGRNAQINQDNAGAHDDQAVKVRGHSNGLAVGVAIGAAVGGAAGVGGAIDAAVTVRTTKAWIGKGADVHANRDVSVLANNEDLLVSIVGSVGGGGTAGVSGSIGVGVSKNETFAYIEDADNAGEAATITSGGTVNIKAANKLKSVHFAGTVAVGGVAGVGISLNVVVGHSDTVAHVGDYTVINANELLTVRANEKDEIFSIALAGSVGGAAGVAGAVNVNVLKSETIARIGDHVEINQNTADFGGAEQAVKVLAENDLKMVIVGGGAAGGLAGVGAAADVTFVRNTVKAEVGEDSKIYAQNSIEIEASTQKNLQDYAIAFGGGAVGVAGAVSVLVVGSSLDDEEAIHIREQDDEGEEVEDGGGLEQELNEKLSESFLTDVEESGEREDEVTADINSATENADIGADFEETTQLGQTVAKVGARTELKAGDGSDTTTDDGDVSVLAKDSTYVFTNAGGVGVGAVGVGAGVAVAVVNNTTRATIEDNVKIHADGDITIRAEDKEKDNRESEVEAIAGAAGFIGVGASVSVYKFNTTTEATIGSGTEIRSSDGLGAAGSVRVEAEEANKIRATAEGASGGAGAAGAQIATVTKRGTVAAEIEDSSASNPTDIRAKELILDANHEGVVRVTGIGGAAGMGFAINGLVIDAVDATTITALIGNNALIDVDGAIDVKARAAPKALAEAINIAASGGASIGAAKPTVALANLVQAKTGDDVSLNTQGDITIEANIQKPSDGFSAEADAEAASLGLLAGVAATTTTVQVNTIAISEIGARNVINAENATIGSISDVSVLANSSGASGGLLAAGSTKTNNLTNNSATTNIGAGSAFDVAGTLSVTSNAAETGIVTTTAGSGGLFSGSSAESVNAIVSVSTVNIGDDSSDAKISAGTINILAQHGAGILAKTDSINASAIGASGADATNVVASVVTTNIGDGRAFEAVDEIDISAVNSVTKTEVEFSAESGSGGLVDLPATQSSTTLSNQVGVTIGDSDLTVLDDAEIDPLDETDRTFEVNARNVLTGFDTAQLDSGGALAVAKSNSLFRSGIVDPDEDFTFDPDRTYVSINPGANLRNLDHDLTIAARTDATIVMNARASTYGLAGAAQGQSLIELVFSNEVSIANTAMLYAERDVNLFAGRDSHGEGTFALTANTRLNNKTAIPIPTGPDADIILRQTNVVHVGEADVLAVRDINLEASEGVKLLNPIGRAQDLWQQSAEAVTNLFRGLAGAEPVTLETIGGSTNDLTTTRVQLSGANLMAGVKHRQALTLSETYESHLISDIDPNAVIFDPTLDGVSREFRIISADEQTEGVTFSLRRDIPVGQDLQTRIDDLKRRKAAFVGYPDVQNGIQADIDVLEARKLLEGNRVADFIDIDDITARSGDINVVADSFIGTGTVHAPGEIEIDIENNTGAFISLGELTIEEADAGGLIRFNDRIITTNGEIGTGAQFDLISSANAVPQINVVNTFNELDPGAKPGVLSPDIYLDGAVSNIAGTVNVSSFGSVQVAADITAATINIAAGKDFIQQFTFGYTHIGGLPRGQYQTVAEASETGSATSRTLASIDSDAANIGSRIAGRNVFISAEYLNINGTIQSGLPDHAVDLPASLNGLLDEYDTAYSTYMDVIAGAITVTDAVTIIAGLSAEAQAAYVDLAVTDGRDAIASINSVTPGDGQIGSFYNLETGQIELSGVKVEGGFMQLYGHILSTGDGKLRVLDGYGTVDIDNATDREIVLSVLDVGRDIEGRIRIIDTGDKFDASWDGSATPIARTTEYMRIGDLMRVYDNTTVDNATDRNPTNLLRESAGRTGEVYQPNASETNYYGWATGNLTGERKFLLTTVDKGQILFEFDGLAADPAAVTVESGPFLLEQTALLGGEEGEYRILSTSGSGSEYLYEAESVVQGSFETTGTETYPTVCISDSFLGCLVYRYQTLETQDRSTRNYFRHQVRSDQPVDIEFIGADEGVIDVRSDTSVSLAGNMRNPEGSTSIEATSGDVLALDKDLRVLSKDLTVSATTGRIGGGSGVTHLNIDLQDQDGVGFLTATAQHDIDIAERSGDLKHEGVVSAQGDIDLQIDGTLIQGGASATISGRNINLETTVGDIGQSGTSVRIDTGDGALSGDVAGNAFIEEISGDLAIDHLRAGLAIDLSLPGSLLDGNDSEIRDTASEAELLEIWRLSNLTGLEAEEAADKTVQSFRDARRKEYDEYWQMRNLTAQYDAGGTLTGYQKDDYDAGFAFAYSGDERDRLKADLGISDAEIDAEELLKTDLYHLVHNRLGGADYDADYVFVFDVGGVVVAGADGQLVTVQEADLRQGFEWTEDELTKTINAALFSERTDTDTRIEDANIEALSLKVTAGGQVGSSSETVRLERGGVLTDQIILALSTAERDDLVFGGADPENDPDFLDIIMREDVDIEVINEIDVTAQQHIFLGSEENDINIMNTASGAGFDVRLKTDKGLTNSRADSNAAVTAHNLVLEGSNASIGSAVKPIIVDLDGTLAARTVGSLFVDQIGGDLNLDFVFARDGLASLAALGAILDANVDLNRNILANQIHLDGTAIGSNTSLESFLDIELGTDTPGAVEATAREGAAGTGGVFLRNDTAEGLILGDLTSVGENDVSVLATLGGLTQQDDTDISSGTGRVSLDAFGNVTIASLMTGRSGSEAVAVVSQVGAIIDGGDTDTDITANAAGAITRLEAKVGIGDGNPLETDLAVLSARNTETGDIFVIDKGDLEIELLEQLLAENIQVDADGELLLGADAPILTPGGDITLRAGRGGAAGSITQPAGAGRVDAGSGRVSLSALDGIELNNPLIGGDLSMTVTSPGGTLFTADLSVTDRLDLTAGNIEIGTLRQTGGSVLTANFMNTGRGGGVTITDLIVTDGRFTSEFRKFFSASTDVGATFQLETPDFSTLVDNRFAPSPAPLQPFDLQLLEDKAPFLLEIFGQSFISDGIALRYNREDVLRKLAPGQAFTGPDTVFDQLDKLPAFIERNISVQNDELFFGGPAFDFLIEDIEELTNISGLQTLTTGQVAAN